MSFRSALAHRGFRLLWLGQLTSRVGDSIHEIALIWVVYEVTGDPTLLSLTFVASFLPTSLLSLPAGAVADRVNRRHLLVGSDLFRGSVVLAIPLVGRGDLLVPTVLTVAVVTGVVDAFDGPARGAIVPNLVPDDELDSANSLTQLTFSVSQVLFAAGGAVVAVAGSFGAFYVDAGSFLLSALLVAAIPAEYGEPDRGGVDHGTEAWGLARARAAAHDLVTDVREVLGYVAGHRLLVNLVVFSVALQATLAPINVALPVYAPALPVAGGFAVGLLYSAFFTGMSVGGILVGRFDDAVAARRGPLIVGGLAAFGGFLLLAVARVPGTTRQVAVVLGLLALAGLSFAALQAPLTTLEQLLVPDERLGRVNSVVGLFSSLAFVAGLAASGPLVDTVGAQRTLLGVGAAAMLVGGLFLTQPLARVRGDVDPLTRGGESAERRDVPQ